MPNPLIKRALQEHNPVIEGDHVTFLWRGKRPAQLMGDWNNWDVRSRGEVTSPLPSLTQVEPDLWMHTLTLPRDTYMKYTYARNGKRLLDPLNPRTTPNGMGNSNNFSSITRNWPKREIEGLGMCLIVQRLSLADKRS